MSKSPPVPEWHFPLRIEKITPNGVDETLLADEKSRAALAARFDLPEIVRLEAELRIKPERAGLNYSVHGRWSADVVQRCVVTLESIPAHLEQEIEAHYASSRITTVTGEVERDVDDEDMEPIENGVIDLGELIAQHLGLALDPYPRKEGVPPLEAEFGQPGAKVVSPFAKLVELKSKKEE